MVIDNVHPRLDTWGGIVNAHDGNLILDPKTGRFWMFGTHYRNCTSPKTASGPPGSCVYTPGKSMTCMVTIIALLFLQHVDMCRCIHAMCKTLARSCAARITPAPICLPNHGAIVRIERHHTPVVHDHLHGRLNNAQRSVPTAQIATGMDRHLLRTRPRISRQGMGAGEPVHLPAHGSKHISGTWVCIHPH